MQAWLRMADLIDRVSIWLGRLATWCVFIACMVSAIN
ncbi:MAG: C4-dicarboxylate ABC transporter substrate-binding protein, partial [Betaproteobacteria bacterium]|nr:C4-dicarboxylate ABC transporter substrate-binding protein [Betaproteobacteria bacterium]